VGGNYSAISSSHLYPRRNLLVIFSEERTIRVFENGLLRGIFGFKGDEVKRNGENYIMRKLIICIPNEYCLGVKFEQRSDCPLTKPLAAASQYVVPPVHCSSVISSVY